MANSIPIKQLQITSSQFRPKEIELFASLMEGGDRFNSHVQEYLRFRPYEKSGTPGGRKQREFRIDSSYYLPHAGAVVNNSLAHIMCAPPRIVAFAPRAKRKAALDKAESKARTDYYRQLTNSADGARDLRSVTFEVGQESMVQGRAYFAISFPDSDVAYPDRLQQKQAGALDAQISYLTATDVDDWAEDRNGNLLWVRVHSVDLLRSQQFGPEDIQRDSWTFIDKETITEYAYQRKIINGNVQPYPKDAQASQTKAPTKHGFPRIPIFPVRIPRGWHLMRGISSAALAVFNREVSLQYALDASAYQCPILNMDEELKSFFASEFQVIKLPKDANLKWDGPKPDFAAISQNVKDLQQAFFSHVRDMAKTAAAKTQSPRMPAANKEADAEEFSIFLQAYGDEIKDALEQAVATIQEARGDDDLTVSVAGLDASASMSKADQIALIQAAFTLPGYPQAARKWNLMQAAELTTEGAPPEVLEDSEEELEQAELATTSPAPVAPAPPKNLDAQKESEAN